MRDLTDVYNAARAELDNLQTECCGGKTKSASLKTQIKQEYAAYKKASSYHQKQFSGESTNGRRKLAISISAGFLAMAAVIAIGINLSRHNGESLGNSSEENSGSSIIVDTLEEQYPKSESDGGYSDLQGNSTYSNTEQSVPTESSELSLNEEFVSESLNGYSVGDFVRYYGTVHYSSSYSNELKGACKGGKAIISGINPNGIHRFHLVSAEDKCTVYGWVDEAFISGAD